MKTKLLFLLLLTSFNLAYSQKIKKKSTKKVTKQAVLKGSPAVEKIVPDNNEIFTEVESMAEFPGGLKLFREKFQNAFNTSVVQDSGIVRVELVFVIDQNGKIGDVKSSGNSRSANAEAIRALISVSELWIPAKINGRAVRYRYRLPVAMQF